MGYKEIAVWNNTLRPELRCVIIDSMVTNGWCKEGKFEEEKSSKEYEEADDIAVPSCDYGAKVVHE